MENNKVITKNFLLDNLLINFPLWFPLIYVSIVINFPTAAKFIFIASLFLFAETHFASTWLFFFDSENWQWLKTNFYKIFFIPLYTLILVFIVWLFSPTTVIIIHYLASGWHVTRQSAAIQNIYGLKNRFYNLSIYIVSFACLVIGLNKPGLLANLLNLYQTNFILFTASAIYFGVIYLNFRNLLSNTIKSFMPIITGILIYLPILFFEDLATATAVGVGMHWCQYLAIMWFKFLRKKSLMNVMNNFKKDNKIIKYILFVFTYASIMTALTVIGINNQTDVKIKYNLLYMIPLSFQLYHFYIDGFIWKFSDQHIRKSVLPFMFLTNKKNYQI